MALIKCPECGREISDKAAVCPQCGFPEPGRWLLELSGLTNVLASAANKEFEKQNAEEEKVSAGKPVNVPKTAKSFVSNTIQCPECGRISPSGRQSCLYCGCTKEPFGTDVWSKRGGVGNGSTATYQTESHDINGRTLKITLFVVLGIAAFIGLLFAAMSSSSKTSSTVKTSLTDAEAFTIAQMIVEDNLRAPSTAEFCSVVDATITHTGTAYTVKGWVDAQNGFGTMIREDFTATFTAVISGKNVGYKNASVVFR